MLINSTVLLELIWRADIKVILIGEAENEAVLIFHTL
jgi:hypothetical protein